MKEMKWNEMRHSNHPFQVYWFLKYQLLQIFFLKGIQFSFLISMKIFIKIIYKNHTPLDEDFKFDLTIVDSHQHHLTQCCYHTRHHYLFFSPHCSIFILVTLLALYHQSLFSQNPIQSPFLAGAHSFQWTDQPSPPSPPHPRRNTSPEIGSPYLHSVFVITDSLSLSITLKAYSLQLRSPFSLVKLLQVIVVTISTIQLFAWRFHFLWVFE